jgi:hypothetical protein
MMLPGELEQVRFHHTAKTARKPKAKKAAKTTAKRRKPEHEKKHHEKKHHEKKHGETHHKDHEKKHGERKHEAVTSYGEKAKAETHHAGETKAAKTAKAAHLPHNGTAHHEQYKDAKKEGTTGDRAHGK